VPLHQGQGRATPPNLRSRHSTEVDRTTMLAGARRRAGLLLRARACRSFHHRASGRSGGAPEQWLLWPPHVGEDEVSDRKANTGVQANEA
jgi:hypothetical protein